MSKTFSKPPKKPRRWSEIEVPCPDCGQATLALKQYRITERFVFAFAFAFSSYVQYTACPKCMRRFLTSRLWRNLPTAHISWPFWVLIPYVVQTCRTLTEGHSEGVIEGLKEAHRAKSGQDAAKGSGWRADPEAIARRR